MNWNEVMEVRLLQMSFSGAVLILVIMLLRIPLVQRMPKKTFLVLWGVALARLLIPFSVPAAFSIYSAAGSLTEKWQPQEQSVFSEPQALGESAQGFGAPDESDGIYGMERQAQFSGEGLTETGRRVTEAGDAMHSADHAGVQSADGGSAQNTVSRESVPERTFSVWMAVYLAGAAICAGLFVTAYAKSSRAFGKAQPVMQEAEIQRWLRSHRLRRSLSVCRLEGLEAPLTYGILHPVILLPQEMPLEENLWLSYVLEHEFVHIRRFDAAAKLLMASAVCIHWFNPLVWVMWNLFNRDIELSCDESAVQKLGMEKRAAYARALIGMEEAKSGLFPLYNSFGKTAIEERIRAIMKMKKSSAAGILAAVLLVGSVTAVFATSAVEMDNTERYFQKFAPYGITWEQTGSGGKISGNVWYEGQPVKQFVDSSSERILSFESEAGGSMILQTIYDENDELIGVEQVERVCVPDMDDNVEYWTCEGFEKWLSQEKKELQDIIGEKGYNPTEGWYVWTQERVDEQIALYEEMLQEMRGGTVISRYVNGNENMVFSFKAEDYAQEINTAEQQVYSEYVQTWEENLLPYMAFGLTYEIDESAYTITMHFDGHEVRGIWDKEKGVWLTDHAGTSFSEDAVELCAVYENGVLTGLRPAEGEEEQFFETQRQKNSAGITGEQAQPSLETAGVQERNPRDYGTVEDYQSLLSMMTENCRDLSVEEFNAALLCWADEDQERTERIAADLGAQDYRVSLTEEAKNFLELTVAASLNENARQTEQAYTGKTEKPDWLSWNFAKQDWADGKGAWCDMYCQFTYEIPDNTAITVGERDDSLRGLMNEVWTFWGETDINDLLKLQEQDMVNQLAGIAAKYSSEKIIFSIHADDVGYETLDERG